MANAQGRYRILGVEHAALLTKANLTQNEVQSITINGTPTGGTFTLSYKGQTTSALAYNATAAAVTAALEALSTIGTGNVVVTGSTGGPYTATFQGTLTDKDVDELTANTAFTGGSNPYVAVATTTTGSLSGDVIQHDLHFINNVGFDVQQSDVAFEGDQQSVRKFFLNGIVINVACDTYDLRAVSTAFNKTETSVTIGGVVHKRTYFGDTAETAGINVGFLAQVQAENLNTGIVETLQFVAPVTSLTVVRPPTLAYNAKAQLILALTAQKTDHDIGGIALPGCPTGGAFWFLDTL